MGNLLIMKTVKYTKLVLLLTYALSLASPVRSQGTAAEVTPPGQLNLMPVPASVQTQTGRLPITAGFNVAVKSYSDDRLRAGIARMLARLSGRTVLTLALADVATHESTASLVVQCERAGDPIPSLSENESYSLEVTNKQARLVA